MADSGAQKMNLLVTFHSVSDALYAQKVLTTKGVSCMVIPVPRAVSSSCGYAVEVDCTDAKSFLCIMTAAEVEWDAVYLASTSPSEPPYALLYSTQDDEANMH